MFRCKLHLMQSNKGSFLWRVQLNVEALARVVTINKYEYVLENCEISLLKVVAY